MPPPRPRFRLRTFLLAVAFIAVACAAMLQPGYWWVTLLGLVAVLLATTSAGLAICCQGARRAFWTGFALASWFLLITSSSTTFRLGPGTVRLIA